MRGSDGGTGLLFSYVDLEARVRVDRPLRTIRGVVNAALNDLSKDFAALYTDFGRPSIAPERLLRAMLLQAFYGIRSERQLMERLEFDLLQEPRPAAGGRDRCQVPCGGPDTAEGEAAVVERSLLGGRHADRGVGLDQELPPEGWRRPRQGGPGPQRRAQLPSGEALQRDAPKHDRSGRAALQEG